MRVERNTVRPVPVIPSNPARAAAALMLAALAGLASARPAAAANTASAYTGGGTTVAPATGDFNTPGNFSPAGVPAGTATTELDFGGSGSTAYTATDDLTGPFTLTALGFNSSASAAELLVPAASGDTFNFVANAAANPTITQSGAGAFNVSVGLTLNNTLAVGGTGAGGVILGGPITGPGGIVKSNLGVLTLTGANTFAGGLTVNTGTVSFNNSSALGTGPIALTAAGTGLTVTGTAVTLANNVAVSNVSGNVTVLTPNNSSTVLNGVISGGGPNAVLFFQGGASGQNTGALTLNGANTFAGTINVQRGPLILGNAQAAGSARILLDSNIPAAGALQLAGNFTVPNNLYLNSGLETLGVGTGLSAGLSGVVSSNGALGIRKVGAGTLTLSGANTYTGPTNVSAGTLALGTGGSIAAGAITVLSGATFAPAAGTTAGTATAGASLALPAGSTFGLAGGGSAGTFTVNQTGGTGLTLGGGTLNFGLGIGGPGTLATTAAAAVTGTETVNVNPVAGTTSLVDNTYNLVTAASGLTGAFQFSNGTTTEPVTVGGVQYQLSLLNTDAAEQLLVSGGPNFFFTGKLSNVLTATAGGQTNFATDVTGATDAGILPNGTSNVTFSVNGGGQNTNAVLGADLSINSLTFNANATGGQQVTISGNNTLTIGAGGITVTAGSGSQTIATAALALGTSQTWTNNSANPFTVSAPITGAASGLTLSGTGSPTFVLTGNNTYGATTVNAGVNVQVGIGGTTGTLGTGAVVNNGTITFNRSDVATVAAGGISGSGNLVQGGQGTAIVGPVTTTGTTTVNSGTLQVAGMTVPAANAALTINGGATLAATGTVTLNAGTANLTTVTGGGTLALVATATTAAAPDLYANLPNSNFYSVQIGTNVVVGPGTHYIGGHSGNNSYGKYGTGDLGLQGSLSGTGGLVVSGQPQDSQFEVALFNDDSAWTGPLTIAQGAVAIAGGNANGLTAANAVSFAPAAGNVAALYLFGNNVSIGNLSGTGAGSSYIRNGSLTTAVIYSASDATLTVNQTTNATFNGVISDGPNDYYAGQTGTYNRLGVTYAGPAALTLTNAHTYTGPTAINGGTLALASGASLGNTAITVGQGATFAAAANTSAGTTTVAGTGASLTVNGGTFDMTAGGTATAVGTFALHQNGTAGGTALTLNGATLNFAVSSTGADTLASDGSASVSGTNTVNLSVLTGGTFAPATYAIISAPSGLTGTFDFANGTMAETVGGVTLRLINTDGAEEVAVNGGATVPLNAYYTGSVSNVLTAGGNGSPTNFATDATGATNTNYLPGATTNLFFAANGAQNLNTTLGADLAVNSVTFNGNPSGVVTVGGANALTVGAGGITLTNSSPGATIATGRLVVGADQTWTNNAGNPLTVAAPVSGGNLTFAGTGGIVLAGANTYGYSNVSTGTTLQVGNGGATGTLGAGPVNVNGTLTFNRTDAAGTFANNVSGTGAIVQAGTGATTLTGAVTSTGGVAVNAGTLTVAGPLATAVTVNAGALNVAGTVTGSATVNAGTFNTSGSVTGLVTVNGGTATVAGNLTAQATTAGANQVTVASGAVLQTGGTLFLDVANATSAGVTDVAGGGTLRLVGTANSAATPDLFFGPDHNGTNFYGAALNTATLDLGSAQRFVTANSGHNTVAKYLATSPPGVDAYIGSSILGSGGITYTGNQEAASGFYAPLVLAGANTFTGLLDVEQGSVYLDNANALNLPAGNPVTLNNNGAGYSHLFLLGNSSTVANLTSGGSTPAATAVGNGNPTMNFAVGAATLTVVETANTTFAGTIADTVSDNYNSGTNVPGSLSLLKTGPATLTLAGVSNYTGSTTVANGTLAYTNPAATLAVQRVGGLTVSNGAALALAPAATHAARQLLATTSLFDAGVIDLSGNDLTVAGGSLSAVTAAAAAGYANGTCNGPAGIRTSAAAATAARNDRPRRHRRQRRQRRPALRQRAACGLFDGASPAAERRPGQVHLLRRRQPRRQGRRVGLRPDRRRVPRATAPLTGWYNGDFNYDGKVDASDYTLIDNAFNTQAAPLTTPSGVVATATDEVAAVAPVAGTAAVPEPAAVGLVAAAAAACSAAAAGPDPCPRPVGPA